MFLLILSMYVSNQSTAIKLGTWNFYYRFVTRDLAAIGDLQNVAVLVKGHSRLGVRGRGRQEGWQEAGQEEQRHLANNSSKGRVQKFLINRLVDFSIKWVCGVPLVH